MWSVWIGPVIVAAVISSAVTALGWLVAHRQSIRLEKLRRDERVQDVQTAVLAEIRANLAQLQRIDLEQDADAVAGRIRDGAGQAKPFTPFVPSEVDTFVLNAIVSDIHILPTDVIDDVIVYYRQVRAIANLVDDLRSDRYQTLEADRKIEVYRDYIGLLVHARTLGEQAVKVLLGDNLNSSAAGRSAPRSDAEEEA